MSIEEAAAELQEELSCSICLKCFSDPVSIHCGHNFCRACITKYWNLVKKKSFCCPQCRETSRRKILRPNRELRNIAEIAPKLNVKVTGGGGEHVCERHQEPLKLFCKDDQLPICVVCDKSMDHRDHAVIPMDEAAQRFKEQIGDQLKYMKQKKEMLLGFRATGAARNQQFLEMINSEMQKTKASFKQTHRFLEEQKQLLLAQWQSLQMAAEKRQEEEAVQFSEDIAQLDSLITEAEGRCQQPWTEIVQVVEKPLSRFKKRKFQESVEMSFELEAKMDSLRRKSAMVAVTLQNIEGTLSSQLEKGQWKSPAGATDSKSEPTAHFCNAAECSVQPPDSGSRMASSSASLLKKKRSRDVTKCNPGKSPPCPLS